MPPAAAVLADRNDRDNDARSGYQPPETAAFAEKWAAFVDAPMVFHDLDVIDDFS